MNDRNNPEELWAVQKAKLALLFITFMMRIFNMIIARKM